MTDQGPAAPGPPPASPDSGTKPCPMCAETVKAEALICRFCGYDFRIGRLPPAAPPSSVPPPGGNPPAPQPSLQTSVPPRPAPRVNGLAIASMVLGIVWLYWVGSILALVFGYIAKGQIDRSEGRETGRGFATAGIVLGWIGVGSIVLVIVVVLLNAGGPAGPGFY